MEKFSINSILSVLASFTTYFVGQWDTPLIILIIFIVLDYFTGMLSAIYIKEVSSEIGFKGITKKVMILILISVAYYLDTLMNNDTLLFRTLVCYFYITNEGISILENAANIGLPIPTKIKEVLMQLQQHKKR